MSDQAGKVEVFLRQGCPFCLKLRLYLLEAGLGDRADLHEAEEGPALDAMRAEIGRHVEKVSFPTARFADENWVADSDAIIRRFEAMGGKRPDALPTYRAYVEGPFQRMIALHKENAELRRRLDDAGRSSAPTSS